LEETPFLKESLKEVRRVVVKVGTNLLRGDQEGLNLGFMAELAVQIGKIKRKGIDVILVSSGAVGAGAYVMGFDVPPKRLSERQALAAIGQSRLMHHYKGVFKEHGMKVAQVLLTLESFDDRQRYLNARNTFDTLLNWAVVPIVNENDTVAVEELTFGDNDQLSALIAGKIAADLLIILTDVEGLFDRHPSEPGARRITALPLSDLGKIEAKDDEGSAFGLGGMKSKLEGARIATHAGILVNISCGWTEDILMKVLAGEAVGTWFEPESKRISARKRWLAFGKRLGTGRIRVDSGAEAALRNAKKSLLPTGVIEVDGEFSEGELISVCGSGFQEIARGLSKYSSADLDKVLGMKSQEIPSVLGKRQNFEVVHRRDLVIMDRDQEGEDDNHE
jgi:glutamate 5-kinase